MKEAVIVAACRTAVGRAPRGTLRQTRPEYMASTVVGEVVKRTPALEDLKQIDDVILGCTFPEAEQGLNIGRVAAQKAGLPDEVPGMTVNRFCSSGLQAISIACERIMVGQSDIIIAGGVESMSLIPMGGNMMMVDPEMGAAKPWAYEGMGMTAENVANDFNISREEQDVLGVRSNELALKAIKEGRFKDEIVPPDGDQAAQERQGQVRALRGGLRGGRGAPARHHPGRPGQAASRFYKNRHGYRGQLLPDERRRGRGDVHVQGKGGPSWASSPCSPTAPTQWPAWTPATWAWARWRPFPRP